MKIPIRSFLFLFAMSLMGLACQESTNGIKSNPAVIEGRVQEEDSQTRQKATGSSASAVEGAMVTAARITADGSLETIEGAEAETDAEGSFSLELSMDAVGDASGRLVVLAENESRQWKSTVAGELQSGSKVELKPLTVESSGEAAVYQEMVANEQAEGVSQANVEAFIGARAAAAAEADASVAAELAGALAAEAEARHQSLVSQSVELTDEQRQNIASAKTEALARLHTALNAAVDSSAQAEAYASFHQSLTSAYIDAGIEAQAHAKASETARQVLMNQLSSLSAEIRSEVRARAALLVGLAVDQAVQASLKAANTAEAAIQVAADAGLALRSELQARAMATESEVEALFDEYNAAMVALLSQEGSVEAAAITEINAQINETAGVKATLEAAVEASAGTQAIVAAYQAFYTAVDQAVSELYSNAGSAEAELVAEGVILVNLAN